MATTKSMSFKGGVIAGDPTPIPVPADALFIVRYNETPASDIDNAIHERKVPYLIYNGKVVELFYASTNSFTFRTTHVRNVDGENILDIVDYKVTGSSWSMSTKEISNSGISQAYIDNVASTIPLDTTGLTGMNEVIAISTVPEDGVYQVSIMMNIKPKSASPTKSNLVFKFTGAGDVGMPNRTFYAIVDDSQVFEQQVMFSTTLNLKAGTNKLYMSCGGLATEYLVFVDDLTVAQLVNGIYNNGDSFRDIHLLTEATSFNNDDGVVIDGANGGPRFMLWTTLANKVLGFIKSLSTTITAFRTGDVIPVDGPDGTAKMSKDDLLRVTAENAVDSGVAASQADMEDYVVQKKHYSGADTWDVDGRYLNVNGGESEFISGTSATDFIEIKKNSVISGYGYGVNAALSLYYFYDEDKQPISGYNPATGYHSFVAEIPDNAVYVRFSHWKNVGDTYYDIQWNIEENTGIEIAKAKDEIYGRLHDVLSYDIDLINLFTQDSKYLTIGGNESSYFRGWSCTDFIGINPFTQVSGKGMPFSNGNISLVFFYDEDKQPISGYHPSGDDYVTFNLTAPINAKYVRLSKKNNDSNITAKMSWSMESYVNSMISDIGTPRFFYLHTSSGISDGEVNFNDPITCFTKIAGTEGKKRLYVDSGTYDILASLGGMDYVNSKSTDTDTWDSVQPVMQDVEIIGKGSVIFNFNLEATQFTHCWLFSCLNVKGDVSVDNVEINASNCRYAIHDEDGSTILKAKKKYCNVRAYKNGIGGQTYGSGYGSKAAVNFINCSFVNSGEQCAWSCHGHTSPRVVFSNCIFENESYSTTDYSVRLSQISQNSLYVVMNNCFVGGKLRLKSEDGGQTNSRTKVDLLNTAAVLENYYTTAEYPVTSYNTIAGTKTVLFGS